MILSNIKPISCVFLKVFVSFYFYSPKASLGAIENIAFQSFSFHKPFHKVLRLFDVLPNFPLTKSETMRDYYLKAWYIRVAS